jgi:multidrug efflux pump subunit AcrA (membrane-fusion protein)
MSSTSKVLNKPQSLIARTLSGIRDFRALALWKKGAIIVIVLLLLWFAGTKVFGQKSMTSQYQTATAQRGSIISTVSESGNVSAQSQVDVTSPSTGIIEEVYVKNGETVSEGQNLFKVKATATPQEKASAYANYEGSLNSYNSALQANKQHRQHLRKTGKMFLMLKMQLIVSRAILQLIPQPKNRIHNLK